MKSKMVREEEFETLTDGGEEEGAEDKGVEEGSEDKTVDPEAAKKALYPSEENKDEARGEDSEAKEGEEGEPEKPEEEIKAEEDKGEEKEDKEEKKEEGKEAETEMLTVEDLKFPEGVTVDQDIQNEFLTIANDKDMTAKERGQALVNLQTKLYTKQTEAYQAQMSAWIDTVKADKEMIGDTGDKLPANLAIAKKGMEGLKVDGLGEILNETGYGNHPAIVKAFYRIGKSISEDSFRVGGVGKDTSEKDAKDVLYPSVDKV
jgi:hypothetical protein|tara:strand:- start:727 stop:1509 length:783 start_codon:yes stop_codon:yes gene_type:complete